MIKKERSLVSKNSNSLNSIIKRTSVSGKQRRALNGYDLLMTITISVVIIGAIFGLVAVGYEMTAFAAKPDGSNGSKDVIDNSNGFPSGKHYNLHISGKQLNFEPDGCGDPGGNTIFTPLYSTESAGLAENQTISMYVNKKTNLDHLVVRDHCTEEFDGTAGQVQLPDKLNATTKITEGMWVFARVLGGPDKGHDENDSNIVLIPNPDVEACSLNDDTDAGTADDCFKDGVKQDFVKLGFITKNGIYKGDENGDGEKLYRYTTDGDTPAKGQGKGAKKAVDITGLFIWSGIGCVDGLVQDGQIMENDFLDVDTSGTLNAGDTLNGTSFVTLAHIQQAEDNVENDGDPGTITNDNDIIDLDDEFDALLIVLALDETFDACVAVDETWVFNLFGDDVDLVIQNHTIVNDGVSNTQIRFYPNQTTTFTP